MSLISLTGTLVYDPLRPTGFNKLFKLRTLIIDLPRDEFTGVYRWFVKKHYGIHLAPPMFGAHVTVVRGDEALLHEEHWGRHAGREVRLKLDPDVGRLWRFWFLPVKRPLRFLHDLRRELGCCSFHSFHLTFGREHETGPRT